MIITNNQNNTENHLTKIIGNLKVYDQVFIAVAFLKNSGLNLLAKPITNFLKAGGQLILIVGQNFALTEPKALHGLRNIFKSYTTSKLYLAKVNSADSVFHPKMYLFKTKQNCCIISGSANLTKGGLTSNKEISISIECSDIENIWTDAKSYFDTLIDKENADEASLLIIKQYETFYEQQKQFNKKAKPTPSKTKAQLAFDYYNLVKYFDSFNNSLRQINFEQKATNYKQAKEILDQIAENSRLSQKQFEPLLDRLVGSADKNNLWHSGSLYRLRRSVYPYFKEFGDLVRFIKSNKDDRPAKVFDTAKEKVGLIEGAAINYVTEIMMTYNNKDFANMNKNPLTVLRKEGGVNMKAAPSSFNGANYEEYCELIKEMCSKLGLQNMLEADSFFNEIYWKIR
jgi:HKD family nuclease